MVLNTLEKTGNTAAMHTQHSQCETGLTFPGMCMSGYGGGYRGA